MDLPSNLQKDILNTAEIAEYMRVTKSTVANALQKGVIKGTQMGGKYGIWVVRQEDFIEYLKKTFQIPDEEQEELALDEKKVVDITSCLKPKTATAESKPITCRVSPETLDKIDRERANTLPILSRSAHLGKVVDNIYVH